MGLLWIFKKLKYVNTLEKHLAHSMCSISISYYHSKIVLSDMVAKYGYWAFEM